MASRERSAGEFTARKIKEREWNSAQRPLPTRRRIYSQRNKRAGVEFRPETAADPPADLRSEK